MKGTGLTWIFCVSFVVGSLKVLLGNEQRRNGATFREPVGEIGVNLGSIPDQHVTKRYFDDADRDDLLTYSSLQDCSAKLVDPEWRDHLTSKDV